MKRIVFIGLAFVALIAGIVFAVTYPVTSVRDTDGDQLGINSDGSLNITVGSNWNMQRYDMYNAHESFANLHKSTDVYASYGVNASSFMVRSFIEFNDGTQMTTAATGSGSVFHSSITMNFSGAGDVYVSTKGVGCTIIVPFDCTITGVIASCKYASTTEDSKFNITKLPSNGGVPCNFAYILPADVSISTNGKSSGEVTVSIALTKGDILDLAITDIGTGVLGSDYAVVLMGNR